MTPDIALVTIGASFLDVTAEGAAAKAGKEMTDLSAICKSLGIKSDDILSLGLAIDQEYRWENNTERVAGIRATDNLRITVRNIGTLKTLLDEALRTKINRLGGIAFTHSKIDSLRKTTCLRALDDARQSALTMCSQMGVSLGKVMSLSNTPENTRQSPAPAWPTTTMEHAVAARPAATVMPGKMELSNSVFAVFEIK